MSGVYVALTLGALAGLTVSLIRITRRRTAAVLTRLIEEQAAEIGESRKRVATLEEQLAHARKIRVRADTENARGATTFELVERIDSLEAELTRLRSTQGTIDDLGRARETIAALEARLAIAERRTLDSERALAKAASHG
ncbi:hypothetical protein ACIBG7_43070 [Nonomuraea sp. NPDC050328]|uniref:hypothetical protein n=1 Tax=Nonomuraea sp. NPDC050328 TaxID=3364361 RepID=UPI0037A8E387